MKAVKEKKIKQKETLSSLVKKRKYCYFWMKDEELNMNDIIVNVKAYYEYRKNNCLYRIIKKDYNAMSIPFYEENREEKVHIIKSDVINQRRTIHSD